MHLNALRKMINIAWSCPGYYTRCALCWVLENDYSLFLFVCVKLPFSVSLSLWDMHYLLVAKKLVVGSTEVKSI